VVAGLGTAAARPDGFISAAFIVLLVLAALFAPVIAHLVGHGVSQQNDTTGLTEAGLPRPPSSTYWFGTDDLGRDVFVRTILRSADLTGRGPSREPQRGHSRDHHRIARRFPGRAGRLAAVRFMDFILSFPFLLAAIALVSVVGPSLTVIIVVIAFFSWAAVGQLVARACDVHQGKGVHRGGTRGGA
jgi:peptide/nickel transport system permease protein